MKKKIKSQWFLLGLIIVFFAVILDPSGYLEGIGRGIKKIHGPGGMIFLIFIISGLMLDYDRIKAGVKDVKSTILALLMILIVAPGVAWLVCLLPLSPGVIIGLFIVSVMPTTLSSGVVMTDKAGGNMAHALFITIVSNSIAIFSIPFILSFMLASIEIGKEFSIDTGSIVLKLSALVLLPLVTGLFLKTTFSRFVDFKKKPLQIASQVLIISIVFVSVANAKQAFIGDKMIFVRIVCIAAIFHLMLLSIAFFLVRLFKVEKGHFESIVFMGAQKTLPLSVMIQGAYFNEYGIALVVCVCHHIVHLIIDGYLSTKMSRSLKF
ncbi:MAG: bile acid:sodium symporter [Desulfobacula sp.]|nr:bile acid:sodium symporter [Desulfobacula sp.]